MTTIHIYTDASYHDSYMIAGYAALLLAKDEYGQVIREKLVAVAGKQNNPMRAELAAVILGLRQLKTSGIKLTLYSDCKSMIDVCNGKATPGNHADLWAKLWEVANHHDITWRWVRGHAQDEHNIRVDQAADQAVKRAYRRKKGQS